MPLVLVPAIGIAFLITFVALMGMHQGSQSWLRPLVDAFAHPHGSFLTRQAMKAVGAVFNGIQWIINKVEHALSVAASHGMAHGASWLHGHAKRETLIQKTHGEFAAATADAFEHGFNITLPRRIDSKVKPVARKAGGALILAGLTKAALDRYKRGIDRLLKDKIEPQTRANTRATTTTLPRAIARDRTRIGNLERDQAKTNRLTRRLAWAGVFASAAALVWSVLRKWKLQWLRCTKVSRVGRWLCGMNGGLLDSLLADALILAGSYSLVAFAEEVIKVTAEVENAIIGLFRELEKVEQDYLGPNRAETIGLVKILEGGFDDYLGPIVKGQ